MTGARSWRSVGWSTFAAWPLWSSTAGRRTARGRITHTSSAGNGQSGRGANWKRRSRPVGDTFRQPSLWRELLDDLRIRIAGPRTAAPSPEITVLFAHDDLEAVPRGPAAYRVRTDPDNVAEIIGATGAMRERLRQLRAGRSDHSGGARLRERIAAGAVDRNALMVDIYPTATRTAAFEQEAALKRVHRLFHDRMAWCTRR
jgi:hypothetical protein